MLYSPLRYPGGKNKLSSFVARICLDNKIHGHYVEPFAGGAGVALFLLLEGYVRKITINDKDRSVYAFWHSVVFNCDDLCQLIDQTEVSVQSWNIQRDVQDRKDSAGLLELGFSTLFLNRTNRSGIIRGGMIGGRGQSGQYKIDCRFNKEEIKKRIRMIASNADAIRVLNLDATDLIDKIQEEDNRPGTIFYFDPPYYMKAESLYMNYYKDEHHRAISDKIKGIRNIHWMVSYDDHDFIRNLYPDYPMKHYSFNHSAFSSREGKEVLIFSPGLVQPLIDDYNPIGFHVRRSGLRKCIVY
jgi:DNA adenine methylase